MPEGTALLTLSDRQAAILERKAEKVQKARAELNEAIQLVRPDAADGFDWDTMTFYVTEADTPDIGPDGVADEARGGDEDSTSEESPENG